MRAIAILLLIAGCGAADVGTEPAGTTSAGTTTAGGTTAGGTTGGATTGAEATHGATTAAGTTSGTHTAAAAGTSSGTHAATSTTTTGGSGGMRPWCQYYNLGYESTVSIGDQQSCYTTAGVPCSASENCCAAGLVLTTKPGDGADEICVPPLDGDCEAGDVCAAGTCSAVDGGEGTCE